MTPPPYTLRFSSDPGLQTLYGDLIAARETNRGMDQGFTSVDYSHVQAGSLRSGGDRNLESAELFAPLLNSSSLAPAYRRFAGEALPWIPSSNATSASALRRFDSEVTAWRAAHSLPTGVNQALAEHIFQWITDAQGLSLRVQANPPERDFDQTLANGGGDCTEFTKVLLALMQRAGFTVFPVWVGVDRRGDRVQHIATGLSLGGRTFLMDPVYGYFDAQHRSTVRLSLREFLAWHWNNRAIDQHSISVTTAEQLYGRALQIDPTNPHILVNRGIFLRDFRHNATSARADFEAALRADAQFSEAAYELGNIEYDAARYPEAVVRFRQAVTLQGSDSRYRRNLILSLVQAGNRTEALRQFDALVRLDPLAPGLVALARLVGGTAPVASLL